MFSIRKKTLLLIACAGLFGCSYRQNSAPVVNVDPIPPDEAMQRRDWPQAVVSYPNGAVAAGPTQFNYEPKRNQPEWTYALADSGTFFVNMALLPYNLIKHPQWGEQIYPGETVGPTFTAQPPLPPASTVEASTPPLLYPGAAPSPPPVGEPGAATPPSPAPEAPAATPAPSAESPAMTPAAPP